MILAHGCSHTHGTWHAQKYGYNPWPEAAAELLNEECVNIAVPGHNCQAVAYETIEWCFENKMPDKIFIGWPGFNRLNNFVTEPRGWQIDLIGQSYLKVNKLNLKSNSFFFSDIIEKEEYLDKKFININTYLSYQKTMSMLMVQNFCELYNIQYYYFSWDNVPWILLPQYEKNADNEIPTNKQFALSKKIIETINVKNNVFWDWTTYVGCARKLHEWWYGIGIIGHGERYPTGYTQHNTLHSDFDHHWGKDMHEKMGKIFYEFIAEGKSPNPTDRNLELLEKRTNALHPDDEHRKWYWETYDDIKERDYCTSKRINEAKFIYD
jgi:hypothetical protein